MAPRGEALAEGVEAASAGAPAEDLVLSDAHFAWLVGSACGFHQLAFDERLLRQHFAPPVSVGHVCAALAELGAAVEAVARPGLQALRAAFAAGEVVAFAWLRDPPAVAGAAPSPIFVVRCAGEEVVVYPALSAAPVALSGDEFSGRLASPVFLVHRAVEDPVDVDLVRAPRPFGFRWFVPELLRHRRIWRDVLIASAVIQLLALGVPLMTQAIIDKVIVHRTESTLIALACGLVLFLVFSASLGWIRQRLILHTGVRVDAVLGAKVFRHLVQLPPRYFLQRPTGVITARLHGVETIREFLASAAVSVLLDLPFLSVCLLVMFSYSAGLTALAAAFLALIVAVSLVAAPRFQQRLGREFALGARNQGFVTEYVAGIETVKSLQMERVLEARYGDYLSAYLRAGYATRLTANTYGVAATTIEQAMTLAILVCGAYVVMTPPASAAQVFTLGMLVAFQMFAARLSQPVMKLVGLWQQFQQARLAVARLGDLMDAPPEPYRLVPERARNPHAARLPVLEVRNLAFRHADDLPYLYRGLTFAVHAGECVAITGRSGCGKSTLARLMQGFCQPTEGCVRVHGVDARNLAANELRATFGVVPQETVLFSGTLLDNLLLANPHASFEDAVAACRMAGIHGVIEQLPRGYRTEIGERGAGLSGGQRQRIAIARALLRRPGVLIFDEATSNLDAQTALEVARTIDTLRGRVTIVFIAHAPIGGLTFGREIRLDAGATPLSGSKP